MNETLVHEDFSTRCHKVLQVAKDLYQGNPDWVTFFREVLGVNGAARNVFPNQQEYVKFEKCDAHNEIQQMVANLRNRKIAGNGHNEATRVITVRLPESLHEALKAEASDHNTSMNKLCISKLLQVLMDDAAAQSANASPASRPSFNPTPQPPTSMTSPTSRPMTTQPGMSNTPSNAPPANPSPFRSQF